jgi:hypothetical protein
MSKRIAMVGCGVVSRSYYVHVCSKITDCRIEWFVDADVRKAEELAAIYSGGYWYPLYSMVYWPVLKIEYILQAPLKDFREEGNPGNPPRTTQILKEYQTTNKMSIDLRGLVS